MSLPILLIVLIAAALHAGWNALLKAGADRFWSMTIMGVAIAIVCVAAAPFTPMPARASWPYAALSALLHVGYNLFLVRAYRHGEFGQTYPIARGSSPVLVCLGAALFAGERPGVTSLIGVGLVSGGLIALTVQGRGVSRNALGYALGTGAFIGAYSVTDGIGVRLSGTPVGYTLWMCLLWGLSAPLVYVAARDARSLMRGRRETMVAAAGGVVSLIAYGLIILAMSLNPLGPVSALRETSVVFAVLIGRLFLNEPLSSQRLAACAVVAVGAVLIGHPAKPLAAPTDPGRRALKNAPEARPAAPGLRDHRAGRSSALG